MKKHIPLLLFIVSHTLTFGMENKKSSKDILLKYSHTRNESQQIMQIRKAVDKFENNLKVEYWMEHTVIPLFAQLFNSTNMMQNPHVFLQYCYYQQNHKKNDLGFDTKRLWLLKNNRLLQKCKDARIDDYSALGATMIAQKISIQEKYIFIMQKLIPRDFQPTPKDAELAKLILYDGIVMHIKTIMHLLDNDSTDNWSILLPEIRKRIAEHIIQQFWLLPGILFKDLQTTT